MRTINKDLIPEIQTKFHRYFISRLEGVGEITKKINGYLANLSKHYDWVSSSMFTIVALN